MKMRIRLSLAVILALTALSAVNVNARCEHQSTAKSNSQHQHTSAKDAPYALQFLDTFSKHHQDAIEMSRMAVRKAQHRELRGMAKKMITDQQKDVAKMRSWRNRWYTRHPKAVNMEMPGMSRDMDMSKLKAASGHAFDLAFIDMMTAHHQSGIEMAQDALAKSEHAEVKTLAQKNINMQQKESEQMNQWKTAWSNSR